MTRARRSAWLAALFAVIAATLLLYGKFRNDGKVVTSLPRYDLERIGAPTLTVSAEDDLFGTFDTARYTAAAIPGARFAGYPTGGHILAGRQVETNAAIAAFLRGK